MAALLDDSPLPMQPPSSSELVRDFRLALVQYISGADASAIELARALGKEACSQGMTSADIASVFTLALTASSLSAIDYDVVTAGSFLEAALASYESESSVGRAKELKRLAHEFRTPLTTLRLTLQVALGTLNKGETLDASALNKAISHVDKLALKITELLSNSGEPTSPPRI